MSERTSLNQHARGTTPGLEDQTICASAKISYIADLRTLRQSLRDLEQHKTVSVLRQYLGRHAEYLEVGPRIGTVYGERSSAVLHEHSLALTSDGFRVVSRWHQHNSYTSDVTSSRVQWPLHVPIDKDGKIDAHLPLLGNLLAAFGVIQSVPSIRLSRLGEYVENGLDLDDIKRCIRWKIDTVRAERAAAAKSGTV